LFYYYGNYSTSLPSIYFLCVLPLPLCASSICFLSIPPFKREREGKEERGERERREREEGECV
jgi:hypothetical protein